jgi:hypothetical protein
MALAADVEVPLPAALDAVTVERMEALTSELVRT